MFPFWRGTVDRFAATLESLAERANVRVGAACLLALLQLFVVMEAGHHRLDMPFNSHSEQAPYFSDPDAPELGDPPRQPHRWSRLMVSRWDAQHYISQSVRGLTACPTDASATPVQWAQCGLGWLPAHGMAAGTISMITGAPDDIVLLAMAMLATIIVNILWTSPAMMKRLGRRGAYGALLAFNVFPAAFMLVTPSPDSTVLALVVGAFLLMLDEKWLWSALLIGAASAELDVANGYSIAFAVAAVTASLRARTAGGARWWRPLVTIPLCYWGRIVELVAFQVMFGTWRAHALALDAMEKHSEPGRLVDVTWWLKGIGAQNLDFVTLVAVIAVLLLVHREVYKLFTNEQARFLWLSSLIVAATTMTGLPAHWGLTGALLLCPVIFVGLGVLARDFPVMYVLWILLSGALYWHVDVCSYITQGNPGLCHCLGRPEFWMPFGS